MENARRIAELEEKIEMLVGAVQVLSAATSQTIVLEYAFEALLRQRGADPEFCESLRNAVSDFLDRNNATPDIEQNMVGTMNVMLAAAGELPQIPDED